jgi:hypothetical protein
MLWRQVATIEQLFAAYYIERGGDGRRERESKQQKSLVFFLKRLQMLQYEYDHYFNSYFILQFEEGTHSAR